MTRVRSPAPLVGLLALVLAAALIGGPAGLARAADEGAGSAVAGLPDAERGRRVLAATGGCTCHTNYPGEGDDAPALAGGRAMETPFGVYYSTNITSDRETGIGDWSDEDFIRAMREGLSPEGEHYFPVFPYTSFAGLTDQDLVDLKAHLFSLPAVRREKRPPDAGIPFRWRWTIGGWKWMNVLIHHKSIYKHLYRHQIIEILGITHLLS